MNIVEIYSESAVLEQLAEKLGGRQSRVHVDGMSGSMPAAVVAALAVKMPTANQMVIAPSKEDAYYMAGDLEALADSMSGTALAPKVMLFPTSYRKAYNYDTDQTDNSNVLMRGETVKALAAGERCVVVTYPEALSEKVVAPAVLGDNTLRLARGQQMEMDDLIDRLQELGFEREDFVVEGGQFAVRGGIVDVYSLASEHPCRIEFFGDEIESLRTFDAATQLSVKQLDRVDLVGTCRNEPDKSGDEKPSDSSDNNKVSLLAYFASTDVVWSQSLTLTAERLESILAETGKAYEARLADTVHTIVGRLPKPEEVSCPANEMLREMLKMRIVEYGNSHYFSQAVPLKVDSEPQPAFGKQFEMLKANLEEYADRDYRMLITVSGDSQEKRLMKILPESFSSRFAVFNLSHGFIDHSNKVLCYTDHEIFERYHKYSVRTPNA